MTTKKQEFNLYYLIIFLYRRRLPILIITLIAAAISTAISFVIPEKFQSTVVFYPAKTTSLSKELLTDNTLSAKKLLEFGEEEETEQLLQILESDKIKSYIIEKHNLMSHYDISKFEAEATTKVRRVFNSNIRFSKTKYMSIRISVLDTDPEVASKIANDIVDYLDVVINEMKKNRAVQAFEIVKKEHERLSQEFLVLQDKLSNFRYYNFSLKDTNIRDLKTLKYNLLIKNIKNKNERLSDIKKKLEEAGIDAHNTVSSVFIIDKAYPAEKKVYPVRWIIVVASTISTFFFIIILLLLVEKLKKVLPVKKTNNKIDVKKSNC